MGKLGLVTAGALLLLGAASAEEKMPAMTLTQADAVVWGPGPAGLPPGAKAAVMAGNPGAEGPFTLRAWLPAGYKVMPHWHGNDEHVTVISGTLSVGMGDSFDKAKATALKAGGFVSMPAKMHHWAATDGDTVIQIQSMGPFSITYVNPADDPRPKQDEKK
jgi:mannose-6-phosphate isomerase-like protein (cupin superfamily)